MKLSQAKELLVSVCIYNLEQMEKEKNHSTFVVPYFVGPPGVGKTAITRQAAKAVAAMYPTLPFSYHDVIVAQYDAGEMGGLGFLSQVNVGTEAEPRMVQRMVRARPSFLPDPEMENGIVGIFNLDELAQAFLANQNICSQLVNDWRIGEHLVSEGITICATGNRAEDKAGTVAMPMHLRDRLLFIEVEANYEEWGVYALEQGIDHRIRSYIRKFPDRLHKFIVGANAFQSPRSWEKTSAILSMKLAPSIRLEALQGQIGKGEAAEFEAYMKMEDKMPDPDSVIGDPNNAPIFGSRDASVLYLLLGALVEKATEKNIEAMITYLKRLQEKEFWAIWTKDLVIRHPHLANNKHVTKFKLNDLADMMM